VNGPVGITAAVIGVALVAAGVLGFFDNPIVGEPGAGEGPVFVTGWVHDVVHIVTGALALFIAFALRGRTQATALVGFGVLYLVVLVATFVDPQLFGIFEHPVNEADHLLHVFLAGVPIIVGWLALQQGRTAYTT
jgi:hypothetical protein